MNCPHYACDVTGGWIIMWKSITEGDAVVWGWLQVMATQQKSTRLAYRLNATSGIVQYCVCSDEYDSQLCCQGLTNSQWLSSPPAFHGFLWYGSVCACVCTRGTWLFQTFTPFPVVFRHYSRHFPLDLPCGFQSHPPAYKALLSASAEKLFIHGYRLDHNVNPSFLY